MSPNAFPIPALDEVRQLNGLFLDYLRANPELARQRFGFSRRTIKLLADASLEAIGRAADFPRTLYKLSLPPPARGHRPPDPLALARDSGCQVLKLTLLQSAWHLSRMSGYAARLFMRLHDGDVCRLRTAALNEVLAMSLAEGLVRTAFDGQDWVWRELLIETRPERRRRLLLIGFQPDGAIPALDLERQRASLERA